ncbi:MAG: hypothetical protein ABSH52_08525 [Terriglobia bacterium]|jgi:hypothetical protein
MTWFALIVFVAFLAIVLITVRRVLRVFRGNRWIRIAGAAVFVADVFVALTAVSGGITVAAGVDKFPRAWLAGTVFSGYLIPGLILAVVVGGSATGAMFATLCERDAGTLLSCVAGGILLGWLVGEQLILPPVAFAPQFWWLEAIYVSAGLMMVLPAAAVRWAERRARA